MKKIGSKIRINGMLHMVHNVEFDSNDQPTYILKRCFDNSLWYARTNHLTRFTRIKRVFDRPHAHLDKLDVMATANALLRRI